MGASGMSQFTFGKVADKVAIVRAWGNSVMMIRDDSSAWSFGSNANGTQGIGVASQDPTYPHKVAEDVLDVFPHGITSFFIKKDGTLWACGDNTEGQMGKDSPGEELNYVKVADHVNNMSNSSRLFHVVIQKDGRYFMAGSNPFHEISPSSQEKIDEYTEFPIP